MAALSRDLYIDASGIVENVNNTSVILAKTFQARSLPFLAHPDTQGQTRMKTLDIWMPGHAEGSFLPEPSDAAPSCPSCGLGLVTLQCP